jgi:catechol 2,3-dioxygenase-like lactoylglutathione lyase family enzyme
VTLGSADLVAFVAATDLGPAKEFYAGSLGLRLIDDNPFALVFDANGVTLRISQVEQLTPLPFTVLGWVVTDVAATIDRLVALGLDFERFGGMEQDARGVWVAPGGAQVAWFKDPDGNILSLTQLA